MASLNLLMANIDNTVLMEGSKGQGQFVSRLTLQVCCETEYSDNIASNITGQYSPGYWSMNIMLIVMAAIAQSITQ
jgi:hypothetical protein